MIERASLYADGGSRGNPGPSGIAFVIESGGSGKPALLCEGGAFIGEATNNEAEYLALLWGLSNASALEVRTLDIRLDSELVVKHIKGEYKVRSERIKPLFAQVKAALKSFESIEIAHIYREENSRADALANEAMDAEGSVGSFLVPSAAAQVGASTPAFELQTAEPPHPMLTPGEKRGEDDDSGERGLRMSTAEENQKTVLLGVTGSIAAYKSCELLRLFQKAGLRVKVVMTVHAQELVGAATFRALSGEPVAVDLFEDPSNPINHISLAEEADLVVVAPCTANVLNKIANGVADDLLTTTLLASTAPLILAPAMNVKMLQHPQTQRSLQELEAQGATIVGPGEGYLACKTVDSGRMSDPEEICEAGLEVLARAQSLAGKKVLITAGPTREHLDPVRFISSPSSGKTGYALAREACERGAEVVLVSGPTELACPRGVQLVSVTSALDMFAGASEHFDEADIAIFSAAVADFRPVEKAAQKIKKQTGKTAEVPPSRSQTDDPSAHHSSEEPPSLHFIELTENPDILATLASRRNSARLQKPFIVGFAAETENVIANAQVKLKSKGADLIIANDVSDPSIGFASDDNQVSFVDAQGSNQTDVLSKVALARCILDTIEQKLC